MQTLTENEWIAIENKLENAEALADAICALMEAGFIHDMVITFHRADGSTYGAEAIGEINRRLADYREE